MVNLGKGITLQQLNETFTKAMQKYAKSTSKVAQEVAECKGKTASEIAEMVSKKDVVALSAKNEIAATPFVEMDLRHNLAYSGLRGETANRVYSDGSTIEIQRFYSKESGEQLFNTKDIKFANGEQRTYHEQPGKHPSKTVCSTKFDDEGFAISERNYRKYIDSEGRNVSYLNHFGRDNKPLAGTIHIDGKKVHFERVKDSAGELTDAYKVQINDGAETKKLNFDNREQLAKHLGLSETCFWRS